MLKKQTISYQDHQVQLEGFYAVKEDGHSSKPIVLVFHDWTGRNEFACKKAEALAELGYAGFAVDMYGNAKLGKDKEEKSALIQPFIQDRQLLLNRMLAAYETAKKLPQANSHQVAAIGFCFGGLCALDLARSGADIKGVVSFHGLLNPATNLPKHTIKARVLALHGFDDPIVTHEQVIQFGEEMTAAKADWELTMYGNTMHAFTNPEANDPGFGTVYNKKSDERSWIAMKQFLSELF